MITLAAPDARASPATQAQQAAQPSAPGIDEILQWILDLKDINRRENALLELSKKRDSVPELAIWLWYSFGTMAALLQEVIAIYPAIMPANLTATQSNRVCNALALMQCVASHKDTRGPFLQAHIPLYLYPFLHTTKTSRSFEYLRLTSLGVIGALVKTDEKEVISFLLSTEIIPLCLRIMEQGTELSKTVATFILQKILLDDTGLSYICQTYERFSHVAMILGKMVMKLSRDPSSRLLKHVGCLVVAYNALKHVLNFFDFIFYSAQQALRQCLPDQLKDETFRAILDEDKSSRHWLRLLMSNLGWFLE
uniref:CCR4-NOT transcription complex subunit 9 n=1 Tax=Angiostrongylus cantonensis TaxID=6313 RepID=A0A0K0DC40_ANGCA